jgi:hypothetical protein
MGQPTIEHLFEFWKGLQARHDVPADRTASRPAGPPTRPPARGGCYTLARRSPCGPCDRPCVGM